MKILENITNKCMIKIHDNFYKVLSKSQYVTHENNQEIYFKLNLNKNKILVILPSEEVIYFGDEIIDTNTFSLNSDSFEYNNEVYEKMANGNQIYLNTSFGEPLEKNCIFTDFENKTQTKIISLGVLEDNKRSDIYAEYIQETDIEILPLTVLITGASRGIGAATAKVFANHGYHILLNYRSRKEEAENLKQELEEEYKIEVTLLPGDISKEEEVQKIYETVFLKYESLNVLVNNAAITKDDIIEDKTAKDFNQVIANNITGTFLMCKYFGKKMKEQKTGKIINISSTNAINTYEPHSIDYDASKAGIISLTHNFAIYLAPYVNVNCIAPGWTDTENNKHLTEDYIKSETEKILLKRFAKPQEVANVIYFLASDEANYINNEVIRVDGGIKA